MKSAENDLKMRCQNVKLFLREPLGNLQKIIRPVRLALAISIDMQDVTYREFQGAIQKSN
ncbi:MAG: hypothetical protein B1H11_01390 [Desulfobacteraceae bacterium 4484_190.1]|nr:MAG: hypothetical protein B1H11_01390 [Desulfobacteraceae bacterium 4484_190.1]